MGRLAAQSSGEKKTLSSVFFSLYYRGKCCYILEQVNSRFRKGCRIRSASGLPAVFRYVHLVAHVFQKHTDQLAVDLHVLRNQKPPLSILLASVRLPFGSCRGNSLRSIRLLSGNFPLLRPGGNGGPPSGEAPSGNPPSDNGGTPPDMSGNSTVNENSSGDSMEVGTPDAGSTQSSTGSTDSANYSSFDEMLEAYQKDIAEIQAGDKYGNNIVNLYNPLNYIGNEDTDNPTWTRILMGASEGDMSMFSSLNLQIAWLNAGVDSVIEWQWDGGHVPSEILGDSLALYVDTMYGKYVDGAVEITKAFHDILNILFTIDENRRYLSEGRVKRILGHSVVLLFRTFTNFANFLELLRTSN